MMSVQQQTTIRELRDSVVAGDRIEKDKLHIIVYGTHGPPHDNGINLRYQMGQLEKMFQPFIHKFHMCSPQDLPSCVLATPKCQPENFLQLQRHCNSAKHGFWHWKPHIIRKVLLERVPKNHYLLYMDSNYGKYPALKQGYKDVQRATQRLVNFCGGDVGVLEHRFGITNELFVDARVLQRFPGINKQAHLVSHRMVFRHSPAALRFLDAWCDACDDPQILLPDSSSPAKLIHLSDQAALVVAVYRLRKAGVLPPEWPNCYEFPHRHFHAKNVIGKSPPKVLSLLYKFGAVLFSHKALFPTCKHVKNSAEYLKHQAREKRRAHSKRKAK